VPRTARAGWCRIPNRFWRDLRRSAKITALVYELMVKLYASSFSYVISPDAEGLIYLRMFGQEDSLRCTLLFADGTNDTPSAAGGVIPVRIACTSPSRTS
jgi:hypothetical protein